MSVEAAELFEVVDERKVLRVFLWLLPLQHSPEEKQSQK